MPPIIFSIPIKVIYKAMPGTRLPLWPIVNLKLSYKGKSFPGEVLALVDSGASGSILKPVIAEALGFDLSKERAIKGEGVSGVYSDKS